MSGIDQIVSGLVLQFLMKIDKGLAQVFRIKTNACETVNGSPNLEEVFAFYQKHNNNKIAIQNNIKQSANIESSDTESSEEEHEPKSTLKGTDLIKNPSTDSDTESDSSRDETSRTVISKKKIVLRGTNSKNANSQTVLNGDTDSSSDEEPNVRNGNSKEISKPPLTEETSSDESDSSRQKITNPMSAARKNITCTSITKNNSSTSDSEDSDKEKEIVKVNQRKATAIEVKSNDSLNKPLNKKSNTKEFNGQTTAGPKKPMLGQSTDDDSDSCQDGTANFPSIVNSGKKSSIETSDDDSSSSDGNHPKLICEKSVVKNSTSSSSEDSDDEKEITKTSQQKTNKQTDNKSNVKVLKINKINQNKHSSDDDSDSTSSDDLDSCKKENLLVKETIKNKNYSNKMEDSSKHANQKNESSDTDSSSNESEGTSVLPSKTIAKNFKEIKPIKNSESSDCVESVEEASSAPGFGKKGKNSPKIGENNLNPSYERQTQKKKITVASAAHTKKSSKSSTEDSSSDDEPDLKNNKQVNHKQKFESSSSSDSEEANSAKNFEKKEKNLSKKRENKDDSSDENQPPKKKIAVTSTSQTTKSSESSSEDSSSDNEPDLKKNKQDEHKKLAVKEGRTHTDNKYGNFVKSGEYKVEGQQISSSSHTEEINGKKSKSVNTKAGKATPFRRVRTEEIEIDERVMDMSFEAKKNANGSWGDKANRDLKFTRGKSFKHEKTKKKRGSYRGGQIDMGVNSIKFD